MRLTSGWQGDTGDRLFLKSLSRRRAGGLSGKFFLPARVRESFRKQVSPPSPVIRMEDCCWHRFPGKSDSFWSLLPYGWWRWNHDCAWCVTCWNPGLRMPYWSSGCSASEWCCSRWSASPGLRTQTPLSLPPKASGSRGPPVPVRDVVSRICCCAGSAALSLHPYLSSG